MFRHLLMIRGLLLVALLAALTCRVPAGEPLVTPLEGEPFAARLVSVQPEWKFEFSAGDQARYLSAGELMAWGRPVDPPGGMQVLLAGGGSMITNSVRLDGESLVGASASLGAWSLPIEVCAGILFRAPSARGASDILRRRIQTATGRGDRVLLDNGDELAGTITGLNETAVTLRGENEPLEIKLEKLAAIMFDPSLLAEPQAAGLRAIVGLNDGSHIIATRLAADPRNAKLTVAGGGELQTATTWITFVQILGGQAVYLSDLKPASYRHLPLLTLTWPYHDDLNVLGAPLRAGGRPYFKGLGMHSPARITYELDGEYRRFEAEVALDESAGPRGSVAFRVFVDEGDGAWQDAFTSPLVRGGDAPRRLSANVSGAKRVSLLVDFADRGDELDHADWLDARLVK